MKKTIVFAILVAAMLFSSCQLSSQTIPENEASVHFFNVGQAASVLISANSKNVLVDCGNEKSQQELCLRLQQLGVQCVDLLVLTHMDEDHIGGADGVLEQFEVKEIWVNGETSQSDSFLHFSQVAFKKGVEVTVVSAGKAMSMDSATLTVLSPNEEDLQKSRENENCICLKFVLHEIGFLFMADAEEKTEETLLSAFSQEQLSATVLGVGHHGSNTSTTSNLLNAVKPQYAVISCGAENEYGHPDGRTLSRLETAGVTVLRTDLNGEIVFTTDGITVSMNNIR